MRYLMVFLLVGSAMAEDFKVDPIQYDIPESKWGKAEWYKSAKCKDPMNLMEVCRTKAALEFEKSVTAYKAKLAKSVSKPVNKKVKHV